MLVKHYGKLGEGMTLNPVRYFYHPESDCLFTADDDSPLNDPCVEEVTKEEFFMISARIAEER